MDDVIFHNALYALAFLKADSAAMAEQQRWYTDKPEYANWGQALESDTESYAGHLGKAGELAKRAVDSAVRADNKENGAMWQAIAAQREAAYGNATRARHSAVEALKLAPASQGAEAEAALASAMAGDTARAKSLAQDLGKRFPLDTQMQSLWLPAIQAQLALGRKNPALALDALQAASPIELGNIPFVVNISCLYPVYLRGEAYLAAGQGSPAAAEFQKILDHNGSQVCLLVSDDQGGTNAGWILRLTCEIVLASGDSDLHFTSSSVGTGFQDLSRLVFEVQSNSGSSYAANTSIRESGGLVSVECISEQSKRNICSRQPTDCYGAIKNSVRPNRTSTNCCRSSRAGQRQHMQSEPRIRRARPTM